MKNKKNKEISHSLATLIIILLVVASCVCIYFVIINIINLDELHFKITKEECREEINEDRGFKPSKIFYISNSCFIMGSKQISELKINYLYNKCDMLVTYKCKKIEEEIKDLQDYINEQSLKCEISKKDLDLKYEKDLKLWEGSEYKEVCEQVEVSGMIYIHPDFYFCQEGYDKILFECLNNYVETIPSPVNDLSIEWLDENCKCEEREQGFYSEDKKSCRLFGSDMDCIKYKCGEYTVEIL